ncbi:heterokaryon incompatibility protein-domain-containing protein [Phaeosphaeriaceae sp. PMI808]|nr:heterokaryon incompatibility protein-domain-containing protein [Phaeosphaeriaceae sp. PMI808]
MATSSVPGEHNNILIQYASAHSDSRTKFNMLKCILDIPLTHLPGNPMSWSVVTRKKFRFIDARSLAAGESLRVFEFDTLPRQNYVALSYVWSGRREKSSQSVTSNTMSIEGAFGADPISIDVLITIGKCVATFNYDLLWIDGVCIIQNDEEDKAWQIQNMFDIYKHCLRCLVLPGGLSRLVPLDEPTSWIHRAWYEAPQMRV